MQKHDKKRSPKIIDSEHFKLTKGDKMALITPSGPITKVDLNTAVKNITQLGFEPLYADSVIRQSGFWAGSPESRVKELHHFFQQPDVKAVMAVRGGYGSFGMLDLIDYELIAKHPKPLIGYSDVSALLHAVAQNSGIPVFHGPMALGGFSDYTKKMFDEVFVNPNKEISITANNKEGYILKGGKAQGILSGGNLAVLLSLLGTKYEPDFSDTILFLEEVNEAPYKIHRMLTQLMASGRLENITALALGTFKGCDLNSPDERSKSYSLREVFEQTTASLEVPVLYGLPFGHIPQNATLPIGIKAELNADRFELKMCLY